jgi:hypothetical protein
VNLTPRVLHTQILLPVWPGLKLIHGVKSKRGDPEYVSVEGGPLNFYPKQSFIIECSHNIRFFLLVRRELVGDDYCPSTSY